MYVAYHKRLRIWVACVNLLSLRIYAMLDGDDIELVNQALENGRKDYGDFLSVKAIKYFADGALGSRGAHLLYDYYDQPEHRGLSLLDKQQLQANTVQALKHGFQVGTHAIGDQANRDVLDSYEQAPKLAPSLDPRLRIEHAQLIDPNDRAARDLVQKLPESLDARNYYSIHKIFQ